jgi:hypothetical protein
MLEVAPPNQSSDGDSSERVCESANGLKPIQQPPNHDGMDLSKLPPMREAILSNEQVIQLLDDIQQLGTDVLLMQRPTSAKRADASKVESSQQLAIARTALLCGEIPRVQIRYRWQNQQWIDTLKSTEDGYHIVRIAHQFV